MPAVPGYFNGTAPERATAVTVNQVYLGTDEWVPTRYVATFGTDFSSLVSFPLPHTPIAGHPVDVYLNGQLLVNGTDYTTLGDTITFIGEQLTTIVIGDVLQVAYVYQAE